MGTIKEKALEKPISLVSYLLWGFAEAAPFHRPQNDTIFIIPIIFL